MYKDINNRQNDILCNVHMLKCVWSIPGSYVMFKYNKLQLCNTFHVSITLSPYVFHVISAEVQVQSRYIEIKQHQF